MRLNGRQQQLAGLDDGQYVGGLRFGGGRLAVIETMVVTVVLAAAGGSGSSGFSGGSGQWD